ncbi:hypothetical protein Mlute_01368 [Meiothermus luteus]|uniref:Uncharacterized protein n=2 Tax=Meiothermus luteus TaxID=2026184 RepID=A0A399EQ66_9DEIN|nr:hypothetical protein Mlute_01368 [Meiothermus luteus]
MPNLTDPHQALELVHALLSKNTDTLTLGAENTSRTGQTSVSVHTDTALTVTDTTPPASVSVSVPSVHTLTVTNAVQDEENPSSVSASVHFLGKEMPTRDPDPSGCPVHWQRVPELPPRGSRVAVVDEGGFGNLYRFKVAGRWYLIKFLPPFSGTVSVTDPEGKVRVLASLEEAARLLQ